LAIPSPQLVRKTPERKGSKLEPKAFLSSASSFFLILTIFYYVLKQVAAPALSSFGSSHASQPQEESAPSGIGRFSRKIIQAGYRLPNQARRTIGKKNTCPPLP